MKPLFYNALRRDIETNVDGAAYFDLNRVDWDDFGERSRSTVISMSPADFLFLAERLVVPNREKLAGVQRVLAQGIRFNSLPFLSLGDVREDGSVKVRGHEGRHRAYALKDLDVREIPVILRTDMHRWGDPYGAPTALEQEDYHDYDGSLVKRKGRLPLN